MSDLCRRSYIGVGRGGVCVSDLWRRSGVKQECQVRVSQMKCQARVSYKSVAEEVSSKSVLQECQVRSVK